MNYNVSILILMIGLLGGLNAFGQSIFLDGEFEDWNAIPYTVEDNQDRTGLEITEVAVSDDADYIYFKVALNGEFNLQDNNSLDLLVDLDNNPSTGTDVNGLGIDFLYEFGERNGRLNNTQIFHSDVGLLSSPTVSSAIFEIAFEKDRLYNNISNVNEIKFFFRLGNVNADFAPNTDNTETYTFQSGQANSHGNFTIQKNSPDELRVLSYNVRRDDIFDSQRSTAYTRVLNAVDADVMCFQEIYDFSASQLLTRLRTLDVIQGSEWVAVKDGPDLITVSRYPIEYHQEIAGNSFVQIDVSGEQLNIFNCHLPCCDNDAGRTTEVDEMLEFLRRSLDNEGPASINDGSPYMFLGDMNFVGSATQLNSLITGNIISNFIYGKDVSIDYGDGEMQAAIAYNTSDPGLFTWYNPEGSFPPGRLDFIIFTDSVLDNVNAFSLDTRKMLDSELQENGLNRFDTSIASDHLPVVCDFRFGLSSTEILNHTEEFLIFPNPADTEICVQYHKPTLSVNLINTNGQKLKNWISNKTEGLDCFDINDVESGNYIVEFILESGNRYVQKVVIK